MWPDWVSTPGPLTYESDALPTALRGPASQIRCASKRITIYRMTGHVIFKQLYNMSVELTKIWYDLLQKKNEHIAHIAFF